MVSNGLSVGGLKGLWTIGRLSLHSALYKKEVFTNQTEKVSGYSIVSLCPMKKIYLDLFENGSWL